SAAPPSDPRRPAAASPSAGGGASGVLPGTASPAGKTEALPPAQGGVPRRGEGGPFALPLSADQLDLLLDASTSDWTNVEPAIFGTLLERALDPRERHKLGAHYTPRAYVERLVMPAVIDPLREGWDAVQVAVARIEEERDEMDPEWYPEPIADPEPVEGSNSPATG